jgi:Asp-tRNA(Asn)/Glu-tRNA(Gln) amidotransferase A subunit family amidase
LMLVELTVDHCGALANTVEDVARLLAAIGGTRADPIRARSTCGCTMAGRNSGAAPFTSCLAGVASSVA